MYVGQAGLCPRKMEVDYTWADCQRLFEAHLNRLNQERDMARMIMLSSGNYKASRPSEIWPLPIDEVKPEYTEEDRKKIIESVLEANKGYELLKKQEGRKTKEYK